MNRLARTNNPQWKPLTRAEWFLRRDGAMDNARWYRARGKSQEYIQNCLRLAWRLHYAGIGAKP